jgi:hypothetical protein
MTLRVSGQWVVMDELRQALSRASQRIEELERRVAALETSSRVVPVRSALTVKEQERTAPTENYELPEASGIFAVLGKAMLGIAGAYLIRAISESGALPQIIVLALGVVYAGSWLFWATRLRAAGRFTSTAYAVTATLIFAPMLAEVTLRFRMISSSAAAALLAGFMLTAVGLSWKRNLLAIAWLGITTAAVLSILLIFFSRDIVPYLVVLLIAASISELAAGGQRWRSLRALVAPAVDVATWTLVYVFSLPNSTRADYVPVPTAILLALPTLLFLMYGISLGYQTLWAGRPATVFEIVQTMVCLGMTGMSWFWFGHAAGLLAFGVACWFLALAAYGATFLSFNRGAMRNYRLYAVWSAALVVAGGVLLLSPPVAAMLVSVVAVATAWTGLRLRRLMPGYQCIVYLAAAAFLSGLTQWLACCVGGTIPAGPGWAECVVAASVLLCFGIVERYSGEQWNLKLLKSLLTLLAVSTVVAASIFGVVKLAIRGELPNVSHVAVVRTLMVCIFALLLAYAGSKWRRRELIWTAYGALAFVTVKLLLEDLRHSQSGSIAISIFLYAVALIVVPRLGRSVKRSVQLPVQVPQSEETLTR